MGLRWQRTFTGGGARCVHHGRMMHGALRQLVLALVATIMGCASPSDSSATDDDASELERSSAPDPVLVQNAKAFFQALFEHDEGREESSIAYDELPANIRVPLARENPNPRREWAAQAFRTKVRNGKGKSTVVYGVIDAIDDQGARLTVYTSRGRQIAQANGYRGFYWSSSL